MPSWWGSPGGRVCRFVGSVTRARAAALPCAQYPRKRSIHTSHRPWLQVTAGYTTFIPMGDSGGAGIEGVRALRALRALRPLRTITRWGPHHQGL